VIEANASLDSPRCSEDPDVKGTETQFVLDCLRYASSCSEDPDVKGTETI